MRDVAAEQGVARYDEVVAGDLGEKFFPIWTAEGEGSEAGGEARRLACPVPDERGGADYEVRAGCGLEIREGLDGFSETHVVRQKTGLAGEQPRGAFDLIGTEARLERAEFFGGGFGGGRFLAAPLGDAGFEIPALGGRNSVAAAFLRWVAIPQDFLEIGGERGVGNGDPSVGQAKPWRAALQKAPHILIAQDGFLPGAEMDMEIQPAIAPLAEGELRLEANDVARHMLESLALADGPFLFQEGEGVGKKTND